MPRASSSSFRHTSGTSPGAVNGLNECDSELRSEDRRDKSLIQNNRKNGAKGRE
jgi:hypothetical protein